MSVQLADTLVGRGTTSRALEESDGRFRATFDSAAIGMCLVQLDGGFLRANRAFCEMLGYTEHELTRKAFPAVTHPDDVDISCHCLRSLLKSETGTYRFTKRYLHRDGHAILTDVSTCLYRDPDGNPRYFITQIQDISEYGTKREEVERERQILRGILAAMPDPMYLVNQKWEIEYANPALERELGPAMRQRCHRYLFGRDGRCPGCACAEVWRGETARQELHSDLTGKTYDMTFAPVSHPDGPTSALCTLHDITERKAAEEAHRAGALGELAAGVAHDFNNLLTCMSGTAQMVARGKHDPQKLLDVVTTATGRGAEITRDLLAFARPEDPCRQPARVEEVLAAALTAAARQLKETGISVVRDSQPGPQVCFDPAQMEQAFLNLILNSCQAMPDGGTLTVATHHAPDEAIITVSDTGAGIPEEHLTRIFEPFCAAKPKTGGGLAPKVGLRLAVAHACVTAHGGTIAVHSAPGAGTTFEIRLPVTMASPAPAAAPDELDFSFIEAPTVATKRVLVVDDEEVIVTILRDAFGSSGCDTVGAHTTAEAMKALEEGAFDLIISDLSMPGGGGRVIMEALKEMPQRPSVIIITGRLDRASHEELVSLGADRTVAKPLDLDELCLVGEELLQSRS